MASTELAKRGTNPNRLNDRQRKFVAEYTIDYDGHRAARAAGYKGNMSSHVHRLLKNPLVRNAIGKIQSDVLMELELTRERLQRETAYCALRDPIDLCDENGVLLINDIRAIPERMRRSIEGIEARLLYDRDGHVCGQSIKIKLASKVQSLELLAKMIGALDPTERSGSMRSLWEHLYSDEETTPALQHARTNGHKE
jgi:phage terminase small subunit